MLALSKEGNSLAISGTAEILSKAMKDSRKVIP